MPAFAGGAAGTPALQDSCNAKSNQQNLGTIKCSNLCTEILEYTSPEETAVCNLASIALPRFVREKNEAQQGPGWVAAAGVTGRPAGHGAQQGPGWHGGGGAAGSGARQRAG